MMPYQDTRSFATRLNLTNEAENFVRFRQSSQKDPYRLDIVRKLKSFGVSLLSDVYWCRTNSAAVTICFVECLAIEQGQVSQNWRYESAIFGYGRVIDINDLSP